MGRRPCRNPHCGELVERGYCKSCQSQSTSARDVRQRGSSAQRGYDYTWQKFREWFLRRHPACEDCGRLATEPHHIKKVAQFPELRLVEENCKALCHECHAKRTARGE